MKKIVTLFLGLMVAALAAAVLSPAASGSAEGPRPGCDRTADIAGFADRFVAFDELSKKLAESGVEPAGIYPDKDGNPVVFMSGDAPGTDVEKAQGVARAEAARGTAVEVAVSCGTAASNAGTLRAVEAIIPDAVGFSSMPDPVSGKLLVLVDGDLENLPSLTGRTDVIALEAEIELTAGSKGSDQDPHYGAAAMTHCSMMSAAEFTIWLGSVSVTLDVMPTAGHCIPTAPGGNFIVAGGFPTLYGINSAYGNFYSYHDLGLTVAPVGESYVDRVWVGATAWKDVATYGHSSTGSNICLSGKFTESCNPVVAVSDNSSTVHFPGQPIQTYDLDAAYTPLNQGLCVDGDSGGLMYQNWGSGVSLRGLLVGTVSVQIYNLRFCYYHDAFVTRQSLGIVYKT